MSEIPPLPRFAYHTDPVSTGSVAASDQECACCGQRRGYVYVGPVFATRNRQDTLCPWCIADGSAHEKRGATFVDERGIGGHGTWTTVPRSVVEEIAFRTPAFSGWQEERWFTCCNDAGVFLGVAGAPELTGAWSAAREELRRECEMAGPAWEKYAASLDREGSPRAYVFQCRHCARYGGYSDCD